MITPEQLAAESEALVKLMNDPRFDVPMYQNAIRLVLNELAWINDGEALPVTQILAGQPFG